MGWAVNSWRAGSWTPTSWRGCQRVIPPVAIVVTGTGGGGVWNTQNERPRQTVDVRKDDEEFMQLMAFVMPIIMEL